MAIEYATASGEEVQRVADKINVALMGESDQMKLMGCLAYVFLVAAPGIPSDILSAGIQTISEHIAIFLTEEQKKQLGEMEVMN